VRRVATGWETTLTIAVDAMVPVERLLPIAAAFYGEDCGTRLTLATEVLGGTWDALLSGRADLIVGADSHGPAGGGYTTRPLGEVRFAFAVAPSHPLARVRQPVPAAALVRHRAVAVNDSSRNLPPRTSGLLTGQEVLAVPTVAAKIEAQCRGLGVGFVPLHLAHGRIERRELVVLEVEEPKPPAQCVLAWRSGHRGRALTWFARRVEAERSTLFG